MNHKQANAFYVRQVNELWPMVELSDAARSTFEGEYVALVDASANSDAVGRAIRGGYAAAVSAREVLLAYANAVINAEGSRSRFGSQARAVAAHARLEPRLRDSEQYVKSWESRASERRVTLPVERQGVVIALLADAELRDIYAAHQRGELDMPTVAAHVADVAERFNVTADELDHWRATQGFQSFGDGD